MGYYCGPAWPLGGLLQLQAGRPHAAVHCLARGKLALRRQGCPGLSAASPELLPCCLVATAPPPLPQCWGRQMRLWDWLLINYLASSPPPDTLQPLPLPPLSSRSESKLQAAGRHLPAACLSVTTSPGPLLGRRTGAAAAAAGGVDGGLSTHQPAATPTWACNGVDVASRAAP